MCSICDSRNYVTTAYLVIKTFYVINAILQFVFLKYFIFKNQHLYPVYMMTHVISGTDWTLRNSNFPRLILCKYDDLQQSQFHSYTFRSYILQCSITINAFHETIFLFLWFWFFILAIISVVSFFEWLYRLRYSPGQIQYIRTRLRAFGVTQLEPFVLTRFLNNYLRRDGVFMVRLIGMNAGELVASEVLCGLWNNYCNPEQKRITEELGWNEQREADHGEAQRSRMEFCGRI